MSALSRRRIDVTIQLGKGQWGEDKGDTVVLTGYRVHAEMGQWGADTSSTAMVQVFGLPANTLNQLTTIGPIATQIRGMNKLEVAAGDDESMSVFFTGTIMEAWAQMQDAPNTALVVMAQRDLNISLKPAGASSYVGDVQAAAIMADLAKEAGYAFENNGVQVTLRNAYFPGTTLAKIQACARAAGIFYSTEGDTLAIWPASGARKVDAVPVISPQAGLVGYPVYSQNGIIIRTLLDSRYKLGVPFEVQGSILAPANNKWRAWAVSHAMESQTPNGPWFTDITGTQYAAYGSDGND